MERREGGRRGRKEGGRSGRKEGIDGKDGKGEFRQHDGVVTMLMFYQRRASPKHRYSIIEVDYGGGGHRTRLKDQLDQLLCLWGAPCPHI